MASEILATRVFSAEDQRSFADMTGDFNPIHMDAIFARRTQAGAPVVHGIHALLWLINAIGERHPNLAEMVDFKVRFSRILYVNATIEARILSVSPTRLRAQVVCDDMAAVDLNVTFGPTAASQTILAPANEPVTAGPSRAVELAIDEMENRRGRIAFATPSDGLANQYPFAARLLGTHAPAALGCSSLLVGMIVPGLHSFYSSLSFSIRHDAEATDVLAFKVMSVAPRVSRISVEIVGGGVAGLLEAFVRRPPTKQPDAAGLAAFVSKDEFVGADALVIGGSRGLGALTAALLAAGGARVALTYAVGATDAEEVAARIRASGGICEARHYDVRDDADRQFALLGVAPTHVYYFATPAIFRQRGRAFSQTLFDEFNVFYIAGFHGLFQACARRRPAGVSFFYPSTVAVDNPPSSIVEYAMSKAAAEILCAAVGVQNPKMRICVSRLPRLPTDQTATLLSSPTEDPVQTMLPLIRAVQIRPT
jgi:acyl dehydratase